jgi:hypothetical protein
MRRAALALGIVALLGLGAYLARLGAGERGGTRVAAPERDSGEERAPAVLVSADPSAVAKVPRSPDGPEAYDGVASGAPVASAATAEEPATLALSGTVVVVDEHGVRHTEEYGRFRLVLWRAANGKSQDVLVARGKWWTEVPDDPPVDALSISVAELGRRRAVHGESGDQRIALPSDGVLPLELRWPAETRLSVRDRASGRELAPVLLVESRSWPDSDRAHPGHAAARARDLGPSPVTLPGGSDFGRRTFHARSPGYAWARVEVDQDRGGEHVLLLDPAGDLEVVIAGEVRDPGTRLRAYGAADAPAFDASLEGDSVLVEALREGAYRVRAEIGAYWAPLVLGEVEADVVFGRRSRVTLALRAPDASVNAPLAGVLVLPEEWQLADFALWLRLTDEPPLGGWDGHVWIRSHEMEREESTSEVFRWSAGEVQTGRYEVRLPEVSYHAALEVGPQGCTDARIEIAPPAEVRVRCIDVETGADLEAAWVNWGARTEGSTSWMTVAAPFDRTLDRWVCRVPVGRVDVFACCEGYERSTQELDVGPGRSELVLELARLTTLAVTLRDGDVAVSWDTVGATARLEAAEGQEDYHSYERAVHAQLLHKRQPGLYRLTIPPIAGYEPVPETLVRLERGETQELVVELRRAQ